MSRLVSLLGTVVRQALWLVALALILAALYVSLGRQLIPLVAEYRLEAQQRAQQALDMPVSIGRLEGDWTGLLPRVVAHDVLLGEGDAVVRLDRAAVVPDLVESLWNRQLRIASLAFDGVHLSLHQDADGSWRVEGLPQRPDQPPADPEAVLRALQQIGDLSLGDSQITFEPHDAAPLTLSYANLRLRTLGQRMRLQGELLLPDGKPLGLNVEGRVNPERWRQGRFDAYLRLPQSDWAGWIPAELTEAWRLDTLVAGGEAWLRWRGEALSRAVVRLNAPRMQVAYDQRAAAEVDDLSVAVYADRTESGMRVLVDGLAFSLGDSRWGGTTLSLVERPDADASTWGLEVDRLDLAPIAALAKALAPLPEEAAEALEALQPTGTLRNIVLAYRPDAAPLERVEFATNLENVAFGAYHGAPGATNVTGSLQGTPARGELRLDSRDFTLDLAQLFDQPWQYRRGRGRLTWTFDERAFTLAAPYLQVDAEEGDLAGDFLIRLMRDPEAEDYMDLRVGLRNGDARFTEKYLPSHGLAPELGAWLKSAIRGGGIDKGYFQYQGSLHGDAGEGARSLSLYFQVHDAELAFQPDWPALREGRGEVLIEDSGVRVRLEEGRILDSRILEATADVPHAAPGEAPRLAIKGRVEGSVADGLKILHEAPIGTAELFAGWQGEGPLHGVLELDIPLDHGAEPHVLADFSTEGARLLIAEPKLELQKLGGRFRYDTRQGLSASELQADVLGKPVRGRAVATGKPGSPGTRIEAEGRVELARLKQWLAFEQDVPASGELPYRLRLMLGAEGGQLQIDSSLQGLNVQLPAPFDKATAARRDSSLRMTLQGPERRYWVRYGDLAALAYAAPADRLLEGRGELMLGGGSASLPDERGVRIRGRLEQLDWSAWQPLVTGQGNAPGGGAGGGADVSLLRNAQVQIGRFAGFGTEIEELDVDLQRAPAGWQLGLQSELLAGEVQVPDARGAVIGVTLQHLRFPPADASPDAAPATEDPLAGVDPRSIPPMDIFIARVLQGEAPLGAWSLKLRPSAEGLAFSDLDIGLKGARLTGGGAWEAQGSRFSGRVEGGNLGDVLLAWGFAPTVTSESFHLEADGRWPGSPAWLSLKRYSGNLSPSLRRGQFVEVEGSAQALRVFGLLNFNSIGRRLRLDFSDLFGKGLGYDRMKGQLSAEQGVYRTREPITVTSPSSNLELDGILDMPADRIDARLLVTLPVTNNLPLAALIVGAPAIGGALFIADRLLGDRLARFATVQYKVEGPWQTPSITFDRPFEKPQ
ncbi:TIGR02099 family protein [Stutzerimonas nosocomialis]|uniref:YhdP family protein n=1 Tax=Stutzerimonas nosocomialis TaxID=1056496 RepID=UPI001109E768|nr:YhdP family protein [Stutzerimonas nosocomialis]TLX60356.1 TIGR02099 family protein [Stutzerimonas nosocomialis]